MVRPCVASGFADARAFSLADRPRLDHLGHQCSHAPGRPGLHLVSSSRRPRLETVDRVTSLLAPHIAQFLCSIGIGGSLTTPPLPHHRTYGSVYGGSTD